MGGTFLPNSPAHGLHIFDDFFSNEGVADTTLGSLGWELVTIGNASTVAYLVTTNAEVGCFGVVRDTTAGTADGDGEVYRLDEDNIVLGPQRGFVRVKFRYPDITGNQLAGNNFRIGLQDSVTATSPTVGIWLDSDAGVLSLQADSADHGDLSVSASGVSTLTSGTTAVLGTWHIAEFFWGGENAQGGPKEAHLYIDNEFAGKTLCNIDDDEEMELSIVHWQDTGGAATLELDIDYIELFIGRE